MAERSSSPPHRLLPAAVAVCLFLAIVWRRFGTILGAFPDNFETIRTVYVGPMQVVSRLIFWALDVFAGGDASAGWAIALGLEVLALAAFTWFLASVSGRHPLPYLGALAFVVHPLAPLPLTTWRGLPLLAALLLCQLSLNSRLFSIRQGGDRFFLVLALILMLLAALTHPAALGLAFALLVLEYAENSESILYHEGWTFIGAGLVLMFAGGTAVLAFQTWPPSPNTAWTVLGLFRLWSERMAFIPYLFLGGQVRALAGLHGEFVALSQYLEVSSGVVFLAALIPLLVVQALVGVLGGGMEAALRYSWACLFLLPVARVISQGELAMNDPLLMVALPAWAMLVAVFATLIADWLHGLFSNAALVFVAGGVAGMTILVLFPVRAGPVTFTAPAVKAVLRRLNTPDQRQEDVALPAALGLGGTGTILTYHALSEDTRLVWQNGEFLGAFATPARLQGPLPSPRP